MLSVHDLIRERLYARAGLLAEQQAAPYSYAYLARTQWSTRFEKLMRNRLIMGALRYGLIQEQPRRSCIKPIEKRFAQYKQSGNLECLVDIANLALIEFEIGNHPLRHWSDIHEDHCAV